QILQEIAWFMFLKGDGIAERGTLLQHLRARFGDVVDDIPVDNNLLVAHMLKPVTTVAGEKAFIEFSHQSFREFLVADRTWRLLEPARKGAGLTVEAWNDVSGRLFTPAKLAFLS